MRSAGDVGLYPYQKEFTLTSAVSFDYYVDPLPSEFKNCRMECARTARTSKRGFGEGSKQMSFLEHLHETRDYVEYGVETLQVTLAGVGQPLSPQSPLGPPE